MPWVSTKKTVVKKKKKLQRRKRVLVKESQGLTSALCHVALYEDEELQSVCACVCVCVCVCVEGKEGVRALHRLLKWEDIIAWPPLALPATAYDHERKAKRNRRRKIVQNSSTDYFLWHNQTLKKMTFLTILKTERTSLVQHRGH